MAKLLQVAEDKLVRLIDSALKAGGLAIHGEITQFLNSIQSQNQPAQGSNPSFPEPAIPTTDEVK